MTDFQVMTRECHGHQHWLNQSGFLFASGDALCLLVLLRRVSTLLQISAEDPGVLQPD